MFRCEAFPAMCADMGFLFGKLIGSYYLLCGGIGLWDGEREVVRAL